ncbi:MAG TPA: orotidine 5'-phosphate decarboxylase / HUMPS family protein [Terriglobia bacterium]|nr:orotidine 5'-phosphate decarboxylase / HUMPS family protein [Terriglobia bacterium]
MADPHTIVQISLDFTNLAEALDMARKAVRAGVDWLEAGTPLILAEGLNAVRTLRREFPQPIVADLKTMDGGYLEAEMMAQAGATHVVVMARAHPATIKAVVQAGRDYGVKVMGDDLACADKPEAARRLQELGADYIVHHIGYDERRDLEVIRSHGGRAPTPLDELEAVVRAVDIPVQAVGGLTLAQTGDLAKYGVHHLVLGAPLAVDAEAFKAPAHDVEALLAEIVGRLRPAGA